MSNEYPLYPALPDVVVADAMALIESFKAALIKVADTAISDMYCDVMPHIETDAWTNMRNEIMKGLCDYNNMKKYRHDQKRIRLAILNEFRDEIIDDLNADMLKEIAGLKEQLGMAWRYGV